ncbi:hypothetical protein H6758_04395 [Candidatus Nomurabacteria bacterium]|nr:hypothetical protein [Candidatus Nomurabacteria bacterium]
MSKYLVSLGVVWVVISLIIGVVLVTTGYNEKADRVFNAAMESNRRSTRSVVREVPVSTKKDIKLNETLESKVSIINTRGAQGSIETSVRVGG